MNTRHVADREHCQELDRLCKEKGIVVPETEFYWENQAIAGPNPFVLVASKPGKGVEMYPAPLVSEQGEWLPARISHHAEEYYMVCERGSSGSFIVSYQKIETDGQETEDFLKIVSSNTEANARQKMINYLIAEGIITTL